MNPILKTLALLTVVMVSTAMQTPKTSYPTILNEDNNIRPPQFQGGENALMEYLGNHVEYPELAKENKVGGRVMIGFTVSSQGEVQNVTTLLRAEKHLGYGLEEAAIKLIQNMPQWVPAYDSTLKKEVSFDMVIPVFFRLD